MPSITSAHRAASALPATIPRGAVGATRVAADAAATRLGVVPPVATMGLGALREHVRREHRKFRLKGGKLGLPELAPLTRAELEDILRKLKGVRAL